jgi:hypothetical protein
MSLPQYSTGRRWFNRSLLASAITTPLAAIFGRPALARNKQDAPLPDATESPDSPMSDMTANLRQTKRPIEAMSEFLNGFHFYADDLGRQVEANHFCMHLSEDFHQCVIYDRNQSNAKLIGIEYIVSERVFKSLPDAEKRLWHSHNYEVKSGELIAVGVTRSAEQAFMKDLVTTYGKTWHTWQIDRHPEFPTGIPQLMMGFTADGQIKQQMVDDRDQRFGTNTERLKRDRGDIPWPDKVSGANAWQRGTTVQLVLREIPVKNLPG